MVVTVIYTENIYKNGSDVEQKSNRTSHTKHIEIEEFFAYTQGIRVISLLDSLPLTNWVEAGVNPSIPGQKGRVTKLQGSGPLLLKVEQVSNRASHSSTPRVSLLKKEGKYGRQSCNGLCSFSFLFTLNRETNSSDWYVKLFWISVLFICFDTLCSYM